MKIRYFSLALITLLILVAIWVDVKTTNSARAATVCAPTSTVGSPYAQDGAGDLCFQTASLCSYINSWNLTTLEVNGTVYTNLYVASNTIAPLNGAYTIHYVSTVAWGHFESGGTCSTTGATNTPTQTIGASPTRTPTVGASPTRTFTPAITNTRTRTPTRTPTGPTATPTRTLGASVTRTRTPTQTVGASPTRTFTPAITNTPTRTLTRTFTPAITLTPTRTLTPTITPTGSSSVLYVGRFNTTDPAGPRYAWSGTTIKANFSGTGISANLISSGDNWFNVIIDGVVQTPLHTPAGTNGLVSLASGLAAGNHSVALFKRTEAQTGDIQFKGFTVTGGQLLAPPTPAARRIEFIGDSITVGYGNEGIDQYHSFTTQNENAYLAYGPVTARALNADPFLIAWSGKGVIRNYSGDTTDVLPSVYLRVTPWDTTVTWNPSQWVPQVVVINLGTNDFASGIPDKTAFTTGYSNFVNQIRSQYPNAHIYCALGPLLYGDGLIGARDYITTVVNQRTTAGDTKLHFIEFPQQDGSLGYGEDWHPSVAQHAAMAQQLINQIKADLGW